MRTTAHIFIAILIIFTVYRCTSSSSKSHTVTIISYDTAHAENNSCSLIRLFFTTGFINNKLTVSWNNSIIYDDTITTDKIKGFALRSVTLPKNKCKLNVTLDDYFLDTEPDTDYCNMLFRKTNDTLFLLYTNKNPQFD